MKYIAYCRKSTDEKDKQVLSIEAQIAELKEFARREHLEITEYITEAKTAKIPGREQFEIVLKKIEKGFVQGIVSWHPDRLARNSIDGGKIIYLLDTGKLLDLKFPSFWFDNTPQGKFMLSIAFGQSKYYVDNLSENVKRGNRQKLRNGVWPSKAPYGYINEPKLRTIEIDPEKSKIIKKAFQLFARDNISFIHISRFLYQHGIHAQTGKRLYLNQIRKILTNRFYIGILHYNGEFYQGSHKCFITKQLFEYAQEQVKRIERPRQKGHNFAFTGIARCGDCGAVVTAEQHIKKYKNGTFQIFVYYRCTKKLIPCTQKYLGELDFGTQLRKIVSDVSLPTAWGKIWVELMEQDGIRERKLVEENMIKLKFQIEEIDTKLNKLLDSFLDSVIDEKIYKQKKNELFEEKLRLQEEIVKVKETGSSWLEPMREFIETALRCGKVARAKNNPEELRSFGKRVGSNFLLLDRQLVVSYQKGFRELCAPPTAQSRLQDSASKSLLVSRLRVELRTYSLRGSCSAN